MAFTLDAGDAHIAELSWSRREGSLATFKTVTGSWTLKRTGFLDPRVTVRVAGQEATVARLSAHLSAHRIEVRGGGSYQFRRAGMLVPAWTVSTDDGHELLHIEPVREGRKLEGGAVLVSDLGAGAPDLLLLVALSWYFIVLAWFEDEALVPFEGS